MTTKEQTQVEASAQLDESGNFFDLWEQFRAFKVAQQAGAPKAVRDSLRDGALGMAARLQTVKHLEAEIEFNPDWAEQYGSPTRIERRSSSSKIKNHFIRWVIGPAIVREVAVEGGQNTLNLYLHESRVPKDVYDSGRFGKVDLLQPGVDFRITDERFIEGEQARADDELKGLILIEHGVRVEAVTLGTFQAEPFHETKEITDVNNVQVEVDGINLDHNGNPIIEGTFAQGGEDGYVQLFLGGLKYHTLNDGQ